jgi:hypothetical protein
MQRVLCGGCGVGFAAIQDLTGTEVLSAATFDRPGWQLRIGTVGQLDMGLRDKTV